MTHLIVYIINSHQDQTVFKLQVKNARQIATQYRKKGETLRTAVYRWLEGDATTIVRSGIGKNFATQSDDGKKWLNLAPRTVEERAEAGFPATGPILMRTGELLRTALGLNGDNRKIYKIRHGVVLKFYLEGEKSLTLHYGDAEKKVPARPFMTLTTGARRQLGKSLKEVLYHV